MTVTWTTVTVGLSPLFLTLIISHLQFRIPEIAFIIYKAVFAIYTLTWLIINIVEAPGSQTNGGQSPFVFLTTWSYILLNLYLYMSLGDAVYMTYKHMKDHTVIGHHPTNSAQGGQVEPVEHDYGMTWYHKVVWVLHDMITGAAPVVSNTDYKH